LYSSRRATNGRNELQRKVKVNQSACLAQKGVWAQRNKVGVMAKGGSMANGAVHTNRWRRRSAIAFV
jgi:hypothetical protein